MHVSTFACLFCAFSLSLGAKIQDNPPCNDEIYVGGSNGEFAISTNGGEYWIQRNTDPIGKIYSILGTYQGNLVIGADNGLWTSRDDGQTWSRFPTDSKVVAVVFDSSTYSYSALTVFGSIYKSTDGGLNWPEKVTLPNYSTVTYSSLYIKGQRYYVGSDDPNRGGLLFTDTYLISSSWTPIDLRLSSQKVKSIVGDGTFVYVGLNEDGAPLVALTDNQATLAIFFLFAKAKGDGITAIAISPYPATIYAAVQGVGVATAKAQSSSFPSLIITDQGFFSDNIAGLATTGNQCVYAATDAGLSISRDGGRTWITKTTKDGLPTNRTNAVFATFAPYFSTTTTPGPPPG